MKPKKQIMKELYNKRIAEGFIKHPFWVTEQERDKLKEYLTKIRVDSKSLP